MDYAPIIQYTGYAIGIIGGVYGILKKREISRLQSKTEKAKAKSYRAKAKAEEARQADHTTKAIGNFLDWFKRGKNDSSGSAEIY